MKAYLGSVAVKRKYLKRVRAHRAADELIQGATQGRNTVGGTFRGCAVVCTLGRYDHKAYETELGIPRILARLEDGIFEGLSPKEALDWPEQFLEAIKVGSDLDGVWNRFAHWLILDTEHGVIKFAKTARARTAIQTVGDLYGRKIKGEIINAANWRAAGGAAADASADAAYAATAAVYAVYAAYAAYAAAAAAYAAYAADAAAYAAYAAAATTTQQKAQAVQAAVLLKLLREAA